MHSTNTEIPRNCLNCELLGSDDNGADPPASVSWPVCSKTYLDCEESEDNSAKPGFPFESKQQCHVPGFWQYLGQDKQLHDLFYLEMKETDGEKFDKTYQLFLEKYIGQHTNAL